MTRRATAATIALSIACGPILCCWIAFASCCCPRRLRSHGESDDKRRFERRQAMAPRPLPVRPPSRALTLRHNKNGTNGDAASKGPSGKVLDQSASRLMRLPFELREMIYRAAIGDTTMHMVLKQNRLGYIRCQASDVRNCPIDYDLCHVWSAFASLPAQPPPTDDDILPLLLTCRQIYSEAIDLVYSTNTFSFSDLDCLRYFSSTILPQRWSLIQNLDVEWCVSWPIYDPLAQALLISQPALYPPHDEATWEATWRIISEMRNLRWLRVRLMYFDVFRDTGCEERLLAPMKQVTLPRTFDVHLGWDGKETKDVPFRVFRPGTPGALLSPPDWM